MTTDPALSDPHCYILPCQLRYEQAELIASLSINVSKIAIQIAAENEVDVDHRTMLSEVLLVLSAPDTDGVDFFVPG